MKIDPQTFDGVKTPCYVMEERLLRRNLGMICAVGMGSGDDIILAV